VKPSPQNHEILLVAEVAERLRLSVRTVTRLLTERRNGVGDFPLPISATKSKGRWLASDIDKYIELQNVHKPDKKSDFETRQQRAIESLRKNHGITLKQK